MSVHLRPSRLLRQIGATCFFCLTAAGATAAEAGDPDQEPRLRTDSLALHYDRQARGVLLDYDGIRLGPFRPELTVEGRRHQLPTDPGKLRVTVDESAGVRSGSRTLEVAADMADHRLVVRFTLAHQTPELQVSMALTASETVRVDQFALEADASVLDLLGPQSMVLSESHQGWDLPRLVGLEQAGEAQGWLALHGPKTDLTLMLGALTQRGFIRVRARPGLRIEAGTPPGTLQAGATLAADHFVLELGHQPGPALERYADRVGESASVSLSKVPPWGWTSWYTNTRPNQTFIEANAAKLATLPGAAGNALLQIDDGWQQALGVWTANKRFPAGMQALAGTIREQGLIPGIWVTPFGVSELSPVVKQHPEWLVRNKKGEPVVPEQREVWGGRIYRLDPSVEGVLDHLQELAARLSGQWGYGFLKLDFLYWGLVEDRYARPGADPREAFRQALEAMNRGAGEDAAILLCGMPLAFAPGNGELVRTGPDAWTELARHRSALMATSRRAFLNGAVYWGDPDVLMMRQGLTASETRARLSYAAVVGGPVLLGDDLHHLPKKRLEQAARLLPPHPFRGRPLDLFESELPTLWEVPLPGGERLLGAFNWDDQPATRRLPVAPDGVPRLVFDLWGDRGLGVTAGPLSLSLPPHDAVLWLERPMPERPVVVQTDAHLLGANRGVEFTTWLPPLLQVRLRHRPGAKVRVTLAAPPGLQPKPGQSFEQRPDGLVDVLVELDQLGRTNFNLRYEAAPATKTEAPVFPPFEAPEGVLVVAEEQLYSRQAYNKLVAEARTGRVVMVFPPAQPAPTAPAGAFMPWTELVTAPTALTADAGTPAAELLQSLGLATEHTATALLNLNGGHSPMDASTALTKSRHAVVMAGDGLLIRLGRLDDAELQAVLNALAAPGTRLRLAGLLPEVRALLATARESLSLDGAWAFRTDPEAAGEGAGYAGPGHDDQAWEQLTVPSTWEAAGHPGYDGVAWYRREVLLPQTWQGLELLLHLEAVDDDDQTWFNGELVGATRGWNLPRRYRIPARLVCTQGPQTLAIRVEDHTAGGGLYRPVRLRPLPGPLLRRIQGDGMLSWLDLDQPPTDTAVGVAAPPPLSL